LVAIPLTAISPRQRTAGRMFLAFVAYFGFFNLQRLAENWMEIGVTPSWLGGLWYQLLMIALVYSVLVPESYWVKRINGQLLRRRGAQTGPSIG
jgi:lipopolysaccharide export system permease protein